MQIAPETDIYLLKTPFEMSDTNQLTFSNATAQYNYFNSLPKLELTDATYQRKDGLVRWAGRFEDVIKYNYCMYRNTSFSNKWFYAYIEDVIFNNANMTEIKLKTDVFQSWQFDITYKYSFVEREHVNNDTIGLHTIDEGLETGTYICNLSDNITIGTGDLFVCACNDFPPLLESSFAFQNTRYNSIFSGTKYVVFISSQDLSNFIAYMTAQNKGDSITSVFILPNSIFAGDMTFYTKELDFDPSIFGVNKKTISYGVISPSDGETFMGETTISRNNTLNGYTPKNNKLLTGKYNYLYISNNAGMDIQYNYEDFVSNKPTFELIGAVSEGGSIKLLPKNYLKYRDVDDSRYFYNYGLTGPKYPICSWSSDSYTAWVAENSLNIALNNAKNIGSILIGGAVAIGSGGTLGVGTAISGITNTFNSMVEKYNHSRTPDQAKGNVNSSDIQYASGKTCFTIYKMSIKQEYAKVIDDYFSMYGYKVNDVKVPNITGRRNWNYVKTIDINLIGDIPQKDLEELRNIFDNGVTLWHNPSTFLDYSQSNPII